MTNTAHSPRTSEPLLRRLSPLPEHQDDDGQGQPSLICFPFAGGSASAYWPMVSRLPETVAVYAVQLPGRQELSEEPPFPGWQHAVAQLADEITLLAGRRFAFFGHSMGAMLAFELARELRARAVPGPELLAVSGAAAPDRRSQVRDIRIDLDDLDCVQALGGIPAALLRRRSFRESYLAVLRADMALFGSYRHLPQPPLDLPLLVFGGRSDELVPEAELVAWRSHCTGPFEHQLFDGGHFFLWEALEPIARAVLTRWRLSDPAPVPGGS